MSKSFYINTITVSRLLLLPLLMVMHQSVWLLCIICWIGFSDFLDGYLARLWKATTSYGATLDQWVDKIVSITLLLFYLKVQAIDLWFVLLFIIREVVVLLARRNHWCANGSTFISKAKTLVTYLLFIFIELHHQHLLLPNRFDRIILLTEILISFLSILGLVMGLQASLRQRCIHFLSTGWYTSLLIKKAPGTITTLLFFCMAWWCKSMALDHRILIVVLLIVLHYIVYPIYIQDQTQEDPSEYTLDEIVAVALLFCIVPMNGKWWALALVVFRFFDIIKPLGIRKFEQSQELTASTRVLGDDILAAFYTILFIQITQYAIHFI